MRTTTKLFTMVAAVIAAGFLVVATTSELQEKICNMIIIKQFANNCPGFDVQFRPFFEKKEEEL
jgi:hypothetical protein